MEEDAWTRRRVAHIFEGGWADASYRGVAKEAQKEEAGLSIDDDFYIFYYKDISTSLVHDLKLEEYGMTKAWVIIEKATSNGGEKAPPTTGDNDQTETYTRHYARPAGTDRAVRRR